MFSHFTLGTNDLDRALPFYNGVMSVVGQSLLGEYIERGYLMYAPPDNTFPHLFICRTLDGLPATWSNGYHIAFNVSDTSIVDRFYEESLSRGGYDEGAPGLRPQYGPDYYGAYVRDPDGNKLQAVCYTSGRCEGPAGGVISHITIGLADLVRERAFYSAVLGELGIVELPEEGDDESSGYGLAGFELPVVYVQPTFDGRPATWGNGTHTAFKAESREAVDRFHAAALANGGICNGPPGSRPNYSPDYYAAYVRDPVGNKLQAVCREA